MTVTAIDNIIYGGPLEHRLTKDEKSLGEFYLERLRNHGDKVVFVDGANGIEITAKELLEESIAFAQRLSLLGVKEGDTIGVCSENRPEFLYLVFGSIFLNATIAPVNVTYTEGELIHALNLTKPSVIFVSRLTIKNVLSITKKAKFIKRIVCFDNTIPSNNELCSILPEIKKGNQSFKFTLKTSNSSDNLAAVVCSSGTTGLPKGVQLAHSNIFLSIDLLHKSPCFDSTVLSVVPWFHAYGLMSILIIPSIGSKCVFLQKFEEKLFLSSIQRFRVVACHMVPPLMVFIAKSPLVDQYDLSSVKAILCGAAPLSIQQENAVKKRIGNPWICQAYGMSETTLCVLIQNDHYKAPGSVGTVVSNMYAKVIDTETGKLLGPNMSGELCFKGGLLMKGYVGDKSATDQIIDCDGWLHTGDVGYYDDNFNFFIVDRIKELIKYKAYQVPPAEIEALLLTNPKIKDAAVIGLPDEVSGELPLAFVVKADLNLTESDVVRFVAERVSPAKRLHGGVRFVNEIPKNPSGKILRRLLRDIVMSEVKSKL